LAQRLRFSGSFIPSVPWGFGQRLRQDFFNLSLELAIVFNAVLALSGDLLAESFGGALALEETRPAIIDAVKFGRMGLASAMGLAAGAGRRGDAAWQERPFNAKDQFFKFHFCLYPNVFIH
jgi:hypothetical protein